jgi:hypothetical protein
MSLNLPKHVAVTLVVVNAISLGVVVLAGHGSAGTEQAAQLVASSYAEPERRSGGSPSPTSPIEPIHEEGATELIAELLARSTAVESGIIEYHVKIDIAGKTTNDEDMRYSFSGESWEMRNTHSGNGIVNHVGYLLDLAGPPLRLLVQYPRSPFEHDPYPPLHAGTLWYTATRQFVRDHASKARVLGTKAINAIVTEGIECDVAEGDAYRAFYSINEMLRQGGKLRLYAARQLGHALPRIEYVDRFGTVQYTFDASEFKEVAPGIFFPATYRTAAGSFTRAYRLKKIERINGALPDSEFVLPIPADTSIHDERPKLTDKVSAKGERTYSIVDYPFRHFCSGAAYPQGLPAELLKEIDRDVVGPAEH